MQLRLGAITRNGTVGAVEGSNIFVSVVEVNQNFSQVAAAVALIRLNFLCYVASAGN